MDERKIEANFLKLGNTIMGKTNFHLCTDLNLRTFKEHFGVNPKVLARCLILMERHTTSTLNIQPEHLLWACIFMKVYSTEAIHAGLVNCSMKTFRKWVWATIQRISDLESQVVSMLVKITLKID